VLPLGKRGDSILGDLHEEFHASSRSRWWYWQQTLRITFHYLFSHSPQERLLYPRSTPMWFDLRGDLRTAFRMLQRNPGTSTLIVATLALAIGTATIGFTFADLALFRGLPVDDASRVVSVFASDTQGSNPRARASAPDLLDYRARTTTLQHISGMREGRAALITNGQSQTLTVSYATANVFTAMGQRPLIGRAFIEGDDAPGAAPVTVLSHHYWRDEMGSRADAIGRTLQIGRELFTVVGVLSPDIEFGNIGEVDLWLPLLLTPDSPRDARNLRLIARLRDGVTFEQAAAEMRAIGDTLARDYPLTNGGWSMRLIPIRDITGGEGFWLVIFLFMLSIGLLIAIATANVSNVIMVRASARARELAVRTAMGAPRGRLLRQFLIEGLVLSILGAALSIPAALVGLRMIGALSAEIVFQQLYVDWHELSFVAGLALICPVVFSLASAKLILRPDLRAVLATQGGRGTTARMRGRGALVVAQLALAVILLTVSSLTVRSMRAMYSQPTGLESDRLLVFGLEFNDVQYPAIEQARAAMDATRDALRAVPGVEVMAMASALPIIGDSAPAALTVDGARTSTAEAQPMAVVTGATPDLDRTLGLRMLAGRWWTEGAHTGAVINREAARRYFGGVDAAIGRRVSLSQGDRVVDAAIIGVTNDLAHTDRSEAPPPRVFVPLDPSARRVTLFVRSAAPASLMPHVRAAVAAQAPAVPIEYLQTFDEALEQEASSDWVIVLVLAGFAMVALALASAGLFGVVSYAVSQRTAEFGTRMALGARAFDVVNLVVRDSAKLIVVGLTLGLAGGIGLGFTMGSLLYGLSPADPVTLLSVIALLSAVTITATAFPAWRAARIDPIVALRAE
jgi:putative ABC transport system permease protein